MAASFRTIIYLIPFPIAFLSQTDSPAVISLLIIYAVLPMKIIRIIIWKITKENILCVLIFAAVFLPQLAERITFALLMSSPRSPPSFCQFNRVILETSSAFVSLSILEGLPLFAHSSKYVSILSLISSVSLWSYGL